MKLTGHTYAYNSLTNFQYEVHAMTGNGNQVNLPKLGWKNSWNHFKWIFLAGFSRLKPLCAMTSSRKKTWICWNLTQFAPPSVKKAQLTIENDYPRETREEKEKWKKIRRVG